MINRGNNNGFGNDSYTKLLLHCNGANDGTTFTDSSSSNKTVTATTVVTKTATKVLGTASAFFNNNRSSNHFKLSLATSADWEFGSSDFTIDFWAYVTANDVIFMKRTNGSHDMQFNTNSNKLRFYWADSTGALQMHLINATSVTTNTWHHVAVVKSGSTGYLFLDGHNETLTTNVMSTTLQDIGSGNLIIGDYPLNAVVSLNGYMDEIRISKGIARWTKSFTTPSREY